MRSSILRLAILVLVALLTPLADAGCRPVCVEKILYEVTVIAGSTLP